MIILAILLAYLLGSVPTAFIFGKLLKGIDIREYGSGNVGATNIARTLGKGYGVVVLLLDFLKGFIAVTVLPLLIFKGAETSEAIYIILGAAAIAGHIWTIFLKFKGGKGVATTAGVMIGLAPVILLSCFVIWIIIFAIWRYVSLASIIAAIFLPIFAVITGRDISFIIFCAFLCLVGVYMHKGNIKRLIQGNESKLK
jgi:glycerol-3-phosphate acyltransferase PlsY